MTARSPTLRGGHHRRGRSTEEGDRRRAGFTDDKLTPEQRYQRDYLVAVAKGQLFWIDPAGADQPHTQSGFLSRARSTRRCT